MKNIGFSDITLKHSARGGDLTLSFREKLELCKLLCRLGVDSVETGAPDNLRTDGLLIKSLSSAISGAKLTVQVPIGVENGIGYVWNCLAEAKSPRLQVSLPVSTVQMEYLYHKKPDAMLLLISESVGECVGYCPDVEFCAEDAGRSDIDFLKKAIRCAVDAGAGTVTVCDTAGIMLPEEFSEFISDIRASIPDSVRLGVSISNEMYMANSCAIFAITAGADEVKVSAYGDDTVSIRKLATVLKTRGESLGITCGIRTTELERTVGQIERLCRSERARSSPFDSVVREDEEFSLGAHDDRETVRKAAEKLGYDLTDEDVDEVYRAFLTVADKKESVSAKELDVLIAASAMQVPPTYKLESYVINSGNLMSASSHIQMNKDGKSKQGISVGDGPIDASFLAIEQITGSHYELDDFQIRAVTEGREAMGEAVVRLRSNGKLYSGRGISTDIVGSSIMAYINALNKIVYEEKEA